MLIEDCPRRSNPHDMFWSQIPSPIGCFSLSLILERKHHEATLNVLFMANELQQPSWSGRFRDDQQASVCGTSAIYLVGRSGTRFLFRSFVSVEMSWKLPSQNARVVEYELWTTPKDSMSASIKKSLRDIAAGRKSRSIHASLQLQRWNL